MSVFVYACMCMCGCGWVGVCVGGWVCVMEIVGLQERINELHLGLEAALGHEDFDLCDALNADITALTRKRDALLGVA